MSRIPITQRYTEGEPGQITGTMLKPDGSVLPASEVRSVLLRVYDIETARGAGSPDVSVINGRDDEEVLGGLNFDMSESGVFTVYLDAADMAVVNSRRQVERHGVRLTVVYDVGSPEADGTLIQEFEIQVESLI